MKKLFAGIATLAVGAVVALGLGIAQAGQLPLGTSPAGTNPIDPPNILGAVNQTLTGVNLAIGNGAALGQHVGLFSEGGFQIAGVTSVGALSLGLNFPSPSTLGSTTVKFWLTFFDSQGKQSYIPVWQ